MGLFAQDGTTLIWKGGQETVRIEPWERHSLRVRGTMRQAIRDDVPGALLDQPPSGADVEISGQLARISSGNLTAEISAAGRLRFVRADQACWDVADQFLLGDDLLVAPVVTEGAAEREVYLPGGAAWRDAWTGELLPGGQRITAPAPLEIIPVYIRDGGRLEPFGGLERFGGAG